MFNLFFKVEILNKLHCLIFKGEGGDEKPDLNG